MTSKGIYASANAMQVHQLRQEAVTHNLANATTSGFKRSRVGERLFATELGRARSLRAEVTQDLGQGALIRTGRTLDLALQGSGFFEVSSPEGPRYVRGGSFSLDASGRVVTPQGWELQGQGGSVRIPAEEAGSLRLQGRALVAASGARQELRVVDFAPEALTPKGSGSFSADDRLARESTAVSQQGALEAGNASPAEEIVELIDLQRRFDAASRSISTIFRIEERLTNELR